jgi:hypothetical protein
VYLIPDDDRPRYVDWEAGTDGGDGPADVQGWRPATVSGGGRNAEVVIDSKDEMFVFHGREQVGTAPAPYRAQGPAVFEFWPLDETLEHLDTAASIAHMVRDTGWMLVCVNGVFGLAAADEGSADARTPMWRLALAYVVLGFYPPLGLGFTGVPAEFKTGRTLLGERSARRVKRALLDRMMAERRELRALSDKIEAHWR